MIEKIKSDGNIRKRLNFHMNRVHFQTDSFFYLIKFFKKSTIPYKRHLKMKVIDLDPITIAIMTKSLP